MGGIKVNIFWFRRDLRTEDNKGLFFSLSTGACQALPLFIFDSDILEQLPSRTDKRVDFIIQSLKNIEQQLGGNLLCAYGKPENIFEHLCNTYNIGAVYCNEDYEPYAVNRDNTVRDLLSKKGIRFIDFKDQVIFSKKEILKSDKTPYTVFTPYSARWKSKFEEDPAFFTTNFTSCSLMKNVVNPTQYPVFPEPHPKVKFFSKVPSHEQIGFLSAGFSATPFPHINPESLINYSKTRDYPHVAGGTSRLGMYIRFGVVSIRRLVTIAHDSSPEWLNELIWREFFQSIIYHFPYSADNPFKQKYSAIRWRNNSEEIEKWCLGKTGYPIVDAGMRELNETGYMHNRVRMITASFFTKHLLADWRIGEAWFASKLLDYDLASNVGNWQWAAGCGCDAAPYFRIFNPAEQARKFDAANKYIHRWVPELKNGGDNISYPEPIVDHKFARERALQVYRDSLNEI